MDIEKCVILLTAKRLWLWQEHWYFAYLLPCITLLLKS